VNLQQENKLSTEYSKLLACKIEFQGNTYNLSQMAPFLQDKNRETDIKHSLLFLNFFKIMKKFDRIYDDMVKVRTTIAEKTWI
jgi:oligoendopeptidase F